MYGDEIGMIRLGEERRVERGGESDWRGLEIGVVVRDGEWNVGEIRRGS